MSESTECRNKVFYEQFLKLYDFGQRQLDRYNSEKDPQQTFIAQAIAIHCQNISAFFTFLPNFTPHCAPL